MNQTALVGGSEEDRAALLRLHEDYIDVNARFDWIRLWKFYGRNVQSSYWTPFDIGGAVTGELATIWCHRRTSRNWTGDAPPPEDIHYDGAEFITRSTRVFQKEDGQWRVVHAHFSEAAGGARPGGV